MVSNQTADAETEMIESQFASDRGREIFLIPDFPIPDSCSVLRRPGGHSEEPIPDPIPNSAVKVLCADGTKSQDLEE